MNYANRTQILIFGPSGQVQLSSIIPGTMTTNINGHEAVTFSFVWPSDTDLLPVEKNYGVLVTSPYLGNTVCWEGFVYDVVEPAALIPTGASEYQVTCFGLQHDVKTKEPNATTTFTGIAPETICSDASLLGVMNTMWNVAGQAAVTTATANTINYKVALPLGKSVAEHWLAVLSHGDGVTLWDWAVWCDPNFGLRSTAKRAQVYFQKRPITGTASYIVAREQLADGVTFTRSMDQVWSSAAYHYTDNAGADQVVRYTPSPAPVYPRYHADKTNTTLSHVFLGDLGLPTGGSAPTGSQIAQLAQAKYQAELTYRLSSTSLVLMPDSILDGTNTGTPVPNELIRAGRLLAIRNTSMRARQSADINLFITQTSLDLQTGLLTVTPQGAKDWATNMALAKKRKGSAKAGTTIIASQI